MQTFLPLPSLEESVKVLDWRRLGKQRIEAKQILKSIKTKMGWIHHPAVKMWIGHEDALSHYMDLCISEWIRRGYKNSMEKSGIQTFELPKWFGDPAFHASHRSNLLRKDENYYRKFGWLEPINLPYIWPKP